MDGYWTGFEPAVFQLENLCYMFIFPKKSNFHNPIIFQPNHEGGPAKKIWWGRKWKSVFFHFWQGGGRVWDRSSIGSDWGAWKRKKGRSLEMAWTTDPSDVVPTTKWDPISIRVPPLYIGYPQNNTMDQKMGIKIVVSFPWRSTLRMECISLSTSSPGHDWPDRERNKKAISWLDQIPPVFM